MLHITKGTSISNLTSKIWWRNERKTRN